MMMKSQMNANTDQNIVTIKTAYLGNNNNNKNNDYINNTNNNNGDDKNCLRFNSASFTLRDDNNAERSESESTGFQTNTDDDD